MNNIFYITLRLNQYPIDKAKEFLKSVIAKRELAHKTGEINSSQLDDAIANFKYHQINNPFYQKFLLSKENTYPEIISTYEDWLKIPIIKKSDIQVDLKERISWLNPKDLRLHTTSGSSGTPFIFAKDKFCHALTWAYIDKKLSDIGINYGKSLQARFYGIPLEKFKYITEKFKDFLSRRYRFPVYDLSDRQMEKITQKFSKTRFVYINGYASAMVLFAKYLDKKGIILKDICPTLTYAIPTSEMCDDIDSTIIQKSFGVPIANEYGASELDWLAIHDKDGDWIINNETLFIEILDEDGNPCPAGVEGRVVATALFNKAMPFIRYELGDRAVIATKTKGCHHILERVAGRSNDYVKTPSGKIASGMWLHYVGKVILAKSSVYVKEYNIIQKKLDEFEIHYAAEQQLSEDDKMLITDAMTKYLEEGLKYSFHRQDLLQRTKSGKLAVVRSEVSLTENNTVEENKVISIGNSNNEVTELLGRINLFPLSLKLNNYPINKAKTYLNSIIAKREQSVINNGINESLMQDAISNFEFHRTQNPFYKKLLSSKPDQLPNTILNYDDWQKIPILHKKDIQVNIEELIGWLDRKNLRFHTTSGSSGTPFVFAKDKFSHALTWAFIDLKLKKLGIIYGKSLQARFYGIPLEKKKFFLEKFKDILSNRYRFPVSDLSDKQLAKITEVFSKKKFVYINGYASALSLYARYLDTKGLVLKDICPTIKLAIPTSEICDDLDQNVLKKAFGVPIANEYGASELDWLAIHDSDGDWVVNNETLFIEILDENNKPCPPGVEGRVVVTSLFNKAMPFIRYELGDKAILSTKTKGYHQILDKVVGRTNDFVRMPSGKVAGGMWLYYVGKVMLSKASIYVKEYTIIQRKIAEFEFHYSAERDLSEADKKMIEDTMTKYLEKGLTYRFYRHDQLLRTKAGKLTHFRSDLIEF